MRRILWWFAGTVTVVVLMLGYHTSTAGTGPTVGAQPAIVSQQSTSTGSTSSGSTSSGSTSSGSTSSGSTSSGSTSSGSASSSSTGRSTNAQSTSKTVTGDVADTQWGPVQVQLTVAGGKITKVAVVQYPYNNGRDQEINDYALPILVKETTQAQSANIDMVSGATVTSGGYLQSLQSALDKANL
jgi:uncharacterized protein with FMN-binding domain